jgi:hypothetical protein
MSDCRRLRTILGVVVVVPPRANASSIANDSLLTIFSSVMVMM